MHIICPRCKDHLEFDGDCRGMEVQCPSCNLTFTAPKAIRLATAPAPQKPSKNANFVSFLLGLVFSLPGVFVALSIGGKDGANAALRGLLGQIIIGLGLYFGLELLF